MRTRSIMSAVAFLTLACTLIGGCAARTPSASQVGQVRTLDAGQEDMRAYVYTDFSPGLEGALVRIPGVANARVMTFGNQNFAAIVPAPGATDDLLVQSGDRIREWLGARATEIHVTNDRSAFDALNRFAQTIVDGNRLSADEISIFLGEWKQNEYNQRLSSASPHTLGNAGP